MPRPIILGVVGDSATGKTTLSRGLVRMLGENNVTHVAADDYHRYDRRQRAEHGITPLHPGLQLRRHHGAPLRRAARRQRDPQARLPAQGRHVRPAGLHPAQAVHAHRGAARLPHRGAARRATTCASSSRRRRSCGAPWKVQRDCSRRGYTTDQVLEELDRREPDSELYIRPQQRWADIVVSLQARRAATRITSTPRSSCARASTIPTCRSSPTTTARHHARRERAPSTSSSSPATSIRRAASEIEEAVWERMHFASHLRSERLGEFTVGTELHRSESLASCRSSCSTTSSPPAPRWRSAATARAPTARRPRQPDPPELPAGPAGCSEPSLYRHRGKIRLVVSRGFAIVPIATILVALATITTGGCPHDRICTARAHRRQPHRRDRAPAGRGSAARGRGPARFHLLVPATPRGCTASSTRRSPAGGGRGAARASRSSCLREAAGAEVTGHVGERRPDGGDRRRDQRARGPRDHPLDAAAPPVALDAPGPLPSKLPAGCRSP